MVKRLLILSIERPLSPPNAFRGLITCLQYYVRLKTSLPMEIEFVVQDIFALTRPQWKLAPNLDEATKSFQLAVSQNQKMAGADKAAEADEATSGASSEDENGDADEVEPFVDGEEESASDEDEVEASKFGHQRMGRVF